MNNYQEHERKLVSPFTIPERQSGYLELLEKPKRRKDIAYFEDEEDRSILERSS